MKTPLSYEVREARVEWDKERKLYVCRVLPDLADEDIFPPNVLPVYPLLFPSFTLSDKAPVLALVLPGVNYQQGFILAPVHPSLITSMGVQPSQEGQEFPALEVELPEVCTPKKIPVEEDGQGRNQYLCPFGANQLPLLYRGSDYTALVLSENVSLVATTSGQVVLQFGPESFLLLDGKEGRVEVKHDGVDLLTLDAKGQSYTLGPSDSAKPALDSENILALLEAVVSDLANIKSSAVGDVVGQAAKIPLVASLPVLETEVKYPELRAQLISNSRKV